MSFSSTSQIDPLSHGPTLASILGVKGPLHFRPHGSSQKPHVVLRRVQISDESSEGGVLKNTVCFSLFASKRIEVKPGKEILLSIANADGSYDNQAIVLTGDLVHEGDPEPVEEFAPTLPPEVIPPKMRRVWRAQTDDDIKPELNSPVAPPTVHSSVAVQAEPAYTTSFSQTSIATATASVQAQPPYRSEPVQAQPSASGIAVQATPVSYTTSTVQTVDTRFFSNTDAQTDPSPSSPLSDLHHQDRSLSPMELDSPTSSARHSRSPVPSSSVAETKPLVASQESNTPPITMSPSQTESSQPSALFSPRAHRPSSVTQSSTSSSRASSVSPSCGLEAMDISPPHIQPIHVAEKHVLPPVVLPMELPSSNILRDPPPIAGASHPSTAHPSSANVDGECVDKDKVGSSAVSPLAPSVIKGHDTILTIKAEEAMERSPLSAGRKRKRSLEKSIHPPASSSSPSLSKKTPSQSPAVVRSTSPSLKEAPRVETIHPVSRRELPTLSSYFVPATKPPVTTPVASTRPLSERIEPLYKPITQSPNLTPTPKPLEPPRKTAPTLPTTSFLSPNTISTSAARVPVQHRLPPTQPQAMASRLRNGLGIPTGPMSNPLGIRPSVRPTNPAVTGPVVGALNKAPPTAPKFIAQHNTHSAPKMPGSLKSLSNNSAQSSSSSITATQRKKIVVGNGWPLVKGSNSSAASGENVTSKELSPHQQTSSASEFEKDKPGPSSTSLKSEQRDCSPQIPGLIADSRSNRSGFTPPCPSAPLPPLPPSPPDDAMYGPPPPPPLDFPPSTPSETKKWKPVNGDKAIFQTPAPSSSTPISQTPLLNRISPHGLTTSSTPVSVTLPSKQPKSTPALVERDVFAEKATLSLADRLNTPTTKASRTGKDVKDKTPSHPPPLPPISTTPATENASTSKNTTAASPVTNGKTKTPVIPSPSPKSAVASTPLIHPLPPKPVGCAKPPAPPPRSRAAKRDRDSPEAESHKKRRRVLRWPSIEPLKMARLKGDGDLGVKKIAFNSDGSQFALCCCDYTVRIWSNQSHSEMARLTHNASVVSVLWLTGDTGVVTLSEDGVVSKWIKTGPNHWQWAKILNAGSDRRADDDPMCLAYRGDRIAVSFPKVGVKVWIWAKGTWQPQRSIIRQNVTAIQFVEDGEALLGGTKDGVLWYCGVPNGTLRAYSFLRSKITQIDVGIGATQALVAQSSGSCHLVGLQQNTATVDQVYKETDVELRTEFGALFAAKDHAVLFGDLDGCVPVWDKKKGIVVYGLDHGEEVTVRAAASLDQSTNKDIVPCIITGTKQGQLCWWPQPASSSSQSSEESARKRQKAAS